MLCDCAILTFATIQSAVRRDPVVVVENLDGLVCDPHINFALYILMWNGVEHSCKRYVIIELNGGLSPFRQFIWGSR